MKGYLLDQKYNFFLYLIILNLMYTINFKLSTPLKKHYPLNYLEQLCGSIEFY